MNELYDKSNIQSSSKTPKDPQHGTAIKFSIFPKPLTDAIAPLYNPRSSSVLHSKRGSTEEGYQAVRSQSTQRQLKSV